MFEELRDRVALVTGAAKGIGRAVAELLSAQGAKVILTDINMPAVTAAAREIAQAGGHAEARELDVADPDAIEETVRAVAEQCGRLDILVNNAGIVSRTLAMDLSVEDWDRSLNINLRGAFLMTRAAFRVMGEGGAVANMSSLAGLNGGIAVGPDYVASKSALLGLTQHFARLGAPRGIRVNAVCPGIIATEVTTQLDAEKQSALKQQVPLGRFGAPEEVARVVLFLISDMASYVSGDWINVTGGIIA